MKHPPRANSLAGHGNALVSSRSPPGGSAGAWYPVTNDLIPTLALRFCEWAYVNVHRLRRRWPQAVYPPLVRIPRRHLLCSPSSKLLAPRNICIGSQAWKVLSMPPMAINTLRNIIRSTLRTRTPSIFYFTPSQCDSSSPTNTPSLQVVAHRLLPQSWAHICS